MRCLSFSRSIAYGGEKRLRTLQFEERSTLPVSAACVVANGVRESLAQLYGTSMHVRLFEPVIPTAEGWAAIAEGALLYRIRGSRSDAIIVLRPHDAAALVSFAFGESPSEPRTFSAIERSVLDRTVRAVATMCGAICAARGTTPVPERVETIAGYVTYVELEIATPVRARIGIALSRDPEPETQAQCSPADLLELPVELAGRSEPVFLTAGELAALEPGAIVPITKNKVFRGSVLVAGTPLAFGECGVREGRFAIAVDLSKNDERATE